MASKFQISIHQNKIQISVPLNLNKIVYSLLMISLLFYYSFNNSYYNLIEI